jgi:predicted AlkP superfamily phosphohydrolase/phosphomutase
MRRLLVIGLDGFETTIAERLLRESRMPKLAAVMGRAASTELDHGAAKRTGLAWEHFATGLSPQGAKRWSAVTFDPRSYRCCQQPTKLPPFPARLGLETVVFDAPYFDLSKADNVRGLVSWGAHDPGTEQRAHPTQLVEEVRRRFGGYPAESWIYGYTWASRSRTRAMGDALVAATRQRAAITRWLLAERFADWSLGIVVVSELHSAVEALWHGLDETHPLHGMPSAAPARRGLEAVYEAVDALIGDLTESFPNASHLIFSMHGMGPNHSDVASMALLAEFLFRRSFGRPRMRQTSDDPCRLLEVAEEQSWSAHVKAQMLEPMPARGGANRLLTRLSGGVRRRARGLMNRVRNGQAAEDAAAIGWMPTSWYAPWWPQMAAFALPSYYDGQIRLNVRGREGCGIVAPAEYDAVCRDVAAALCACTDPRTGQSVVREVIRTHPGDPMAVSETEADMIILWQGSPLALQPPGADPIGPLAYRRPGGHTGGHGLSLWLGADFSPGTHGVHSAFDVVPTLIDYLTGSSDPACDGQSFLAEIARDRVQKREVPARAAKMMARAVQA